MGPSRIRKHQLFFLMDIPHDCRLSTFEGWSWRHFITGTRELTTTCPVLPKISIFSRRCARCPTCPLKADVPTQGWQCLWRHRTLYVDRYSVLQGSNVLAYRSHRSLSQNGYGGIYMRGHWNREAQSIYRRTYAGMAVPLTPSNAVRR